MKPVRTLPPTAAPLGLGDVLLSALKSFSGSAPEARLAREIQDYLGVKHVFFVSSGKAALAIALQALFRLRRVRRVIIPAYTCFSVPAAVIRAGLEPVLADVDPSTLDFDEASLKRALEYRDVLGVVPTHLFGVPANVDRLRALTRPQNIFVLEDAAQAFGLAHDNGQRLGSLGDVGVLSLGRGKHLTCGGGGIIATSSAAIAGQCRDLCAALPPAGFGRALRVWLELAALSVFIDPRLYWLPAQLPFLGLGRTVYDPQFAVTRLPRSSYGALMRWRARLDAENGIRTQASREWADALGIDGRRPGLLRFPLLLQSKEERSAMLEQAGPRLGVSRMYPSAVHQIPELRERFANQRFPGAEALAARLVTLPTHRYVTDADRSAFRTMRSSLGNVFTEADTHRATASC